MLSAQGVSWLFGFVLLVPVALAARGKSRPGRPKQPPPPRKKQSSWRFPLIAVSLALLAAAISLGVRLGFRRLPEAPAPAVDSMGGPAQDSQKGQGALPPVLDGALRERMQATVTKNCPRLAAITWGDAGRPRKLVVDLVSVECMSLMCEQPETLDAGSPSLSHRAEPLCESSFLTMKDQMLAVTNDYRLACPEIAVPWAERPWSPSIELGFYSALRPCLERICEELVSGEGIPAKYCTIAADLAEGLGDVRAAARLRKRAEAVQALSEAQWQELSPEERENAETDQDMKILARRWGEVCRQGMRKYCDFLANYCRVEGHPADVCPAQGLAPASRDAGPR